jgi:hypothetical protein
MGGWAPCHLTHAGSLGALAALEGADSRSFIEWVSAVVQRAHWQLPVIARLLKWHDLSYSGQYLEPIGLD